jgi:hypothetical protein
MSSSRLAIVSQGGFEYVRNKAGISLPTNVEFPILIDDLILKY